MFSIYQIDENLIETIIGLLHADQDLISVVTKLPIAEPATLIKDQILSELNINTTQNGKYILPDDISLSKIYMIEKYDKILEGYIYNSTVSEIKILFTWRLIPFNDMVSIQQIELIPEIDNSVANTDLTLYDISFDLDYFDSTSEKYFSQNYLDYDFSVSNENSDFDSNVDNNFDNDFQEEELTINFREINLSSLCNSSNIYIVGNKNSGKSKTASNILDCLDYKYNFSDLLIINPTERRTPFYSKQYFGATILTEINYDIISMFIFKASKNMEKQKCVIFDDCWTNDLCYDNNTNYPLMELLYHGKEYGITVIMTTMIPIKKVELIVNFDYIFLLRENQINDNYQKMLYDYYCGFMSSFNIFKGIYDIITIDYNAMVINNNGISGNKILKYRSLCD